MIFKVFHVKRPTFNPETSPVFNLDKYLPDYEHVATVECEDIEHAFQVTNHITHDWTTNKEVVWKKGDGSNTRSTSVGDVIIDSNNKAFRVRLCIGFGEIK